MFVCPDRAALIERCGRRSVLFSVGLQERIDQPMSD
jgi:hypothetical protein